MKKELFALFLLAVSLPLCARPNTITMVTDFPGNNLVYFSLKADTVDMIQGASVRLANATLTVENTTTVSDELGFNNIANLQTGKVAIGNTGSESPSDVRFGDLTVYQSTLPMGLGTETLELNDNASITLGDVAVGNLFSGCVESDNQAYWAEESGKTFLVCDANAQKKEYVWKSVACSGGFYNGKSCSSLPQFKDNPANKPCAPMSELVKFNENVYDCKEK